MADKPISELPEKEFLENDIQEYGFNSIQLQQLRLLIREELDKKMTIDVSEIKRRLR